MAKTNENINFNNNNNNSNSDYLEKAIKRYGQLGGEILIVDLVKGITGLGLSLAGNRDRNKMSVFICGMHMKGAAAKDGRIKVADEILEINGVVLHGRCHLNASATIKSLPGPVFKMVLLRREGALDEMAVKPLIQFPVHLEEETLQEKYNKFHGVRTVTVRKGNTGLGIMIIEGKHTELGRGVFISDIQESSPAEQAGLAVGDMILCVNQTDLVGADYDTAASTLKNAEGLLSIVVAKPHRVSSRSDQGSTAQLNQGDSESAQNDQKKDQKNGKDLPSPIGGGEETITLDPNTCEIIPERETTLEIAKKKMGLGLSIVGGSDTPLGAVIIHEVYPDGAAAFDGRLKPGDVILQVNDENLRNVPHEFAISALRQTPSTIRMVVYREETHSADTDLYEIMDIELYKKLGKGLGLSIVGRKNGPGVYVSEVVKGGVAEADGRLLQGDHILQVNEHDLRNATHEHAAAILKTTIGKITMKIGRLKTGIRLSHSGEKSSSVNKFS